MARSKQPPLPPLRLVAGPQLMAAALARTQTRIATLNRPNIAAHVADLHSRTRDQWLADEYRVQSALRALADGSKKKAGR